jgi:hypothetical protein
MPQTLLTPRAPTTGFLGQFSQPRIKDEAIRSYLPEVGAYSVRQAARLPRRPNSHDGFFCFRWILKSLHPIEAPGGRQQDAQLQPIPASLTHIYNHIYVSSYEAMPQVLDMMNAQVPS